MQIDEQSSRDLTCQAVSSPLSGRKPSRCGALILNADDWGMDSQTTGRIYDCFRCGALSSVSAMVFMKDSERAASLSREYAIDAGLHLNLTAPFSASLCSPNLQKHQGRLAAFLRRYSFARSLYHPGLAGSFEYVVRAQIEEYARIYGAEPQRVDGHHHMHLSANVLLAGLLPAGAILRRHFSWERGEKALRNGIFRRLTGALLSRRYRSADFFFSLPPLVPEERLRRIASLADHSIVEVETHPVNPEEYLFLTEGNVFRWAGNRPISRSYAGVIPGSGVCKSQEDPGARAGA